MDDKVRRITSFRRRRSPQLQSSIAAFAVWRNQCARLTDRYLLNRRSASAMRSISR